MLIACWGWQWERLCTETLNEMQRCSKEMPGLWETAVRSREYQGGGGNLHRGDRQQGRFNRGFNRENIHKKCGGSKSTKKNKDTWIIKLSQEIKVTSWGIVVVWAGKCRNVALSYECTILLCRGFDGSDNSCAVSDTRGGKESHYPPRVQTQKKPTLLKLLLKYPMLDFIIWVW